MLLRQRVRRAPRLQAGAWEQAGAFSGRLLLPLNARLRPLSLAHMCMAGACPRRKRVTICGQSFELSAFTHANGRPPVQQACLAPSCKHRTESAATTSRRVGAWAGPSAGACYFRSTPTSVRLRSRKCVWAGACPRRKRITIYGPVLCAFSIHSRKRTASCSTGLLGAARASTASSAWLRSRRRIGAVDRLVVNPCSSRSARLPARLQPYVRSLFLFVVDVFLC